MSWEESCNYKQWLITGQCKCVHVAACKVGKNWHKAWLFASSFSVLAQLASICDHECCTHEQIAGRRNASGHFLSRVTAKYASQLVEAFSDIILSLQFTNY